MSNYFNKILVTGGGGQLGNAIHQHPLATTFQLSACSRAELDITDTISIENAISKYQPEIIINCAAYTAVDKAEQEIDTAQRINQQGAEYLARACKQHHLPLIHLSTDYIFDGNANSPYQEDALPHPINAYGKSKWDGEQAIRAELDQHIILRVSGVFSEYGYNFLKTILRLAKERDMLRIVADQFTCPTYAGDIATAIFTLVKQLPRWGTYHYCSNQAVSWHQFAVALIAEAKRYQPLRVQEIAAITTNEYPTAAKRPAYSVLACDKIKKDFNLTLPSWQTAIQHVIGKLIQES